MATPFLSNSVQTYGREEEIIQTSEDDVSTKVDNPRTRTDTTPENTVTRARLEHVVTATRVRQPATTTVTRTAPTEGQETQSEQHETLSFSYKIRLREKHPVPPAGESLDNSCPV